MTLLRGAAWLVAGALAAGCGSDRVTCECPATPPRGCVYTGRPGCACAAMVCSDVGPLVDAVADVGRDVGTDAGTDVGTDVGFDAGTDVGTDAGADAGADVGTDAGTDVGSDAARDVVADDSAPACDFSATGLRRGCENDSQCRVGTFTSDCCGSTRAVAINATARDAFEDFRDGCARRYGGPRMCACPTLPTMLEDGAIVTNLSRIGVACMGGLCTTRLIP